MLPRAIFSWRDWGKPTKKLSQKSLCPGRDSKRAFPEYQFMASCYWNLVGCIMKMDGLGPFNFRLSDIRLYIYSTIPHKNTKPQHKTYWCWFCCCVFTPWGLWQCQIFDPENGGCTYLRKVGNTAHIHMMRGSKSKIRINNERLWKS
jgi:hypothetical protein